MLIIRYLLTIILFISGIYGLIFCFINDFNLKFLLLSLVCFLLAYWVKPKRIHQRKYDGWDILDIIDFPVELVFYIITLPFRLLRGIFDFFSPDL